MKKWNFKARSNPQEILKKLETSFGSGDTFVFNMEHDSNSITFDLRKRVIYPSQILLRNRIIVKGKLLKTTTKNETDAEISFTQHFLITFNILLFLGLGLFAITLGIVKDTSMYLSGGVLLAIGVLFWLAAKKKLKQDSKKYRELISKVLAL